MKLRNYSPHILKKIGYSGGGMHWLLSIKKKFYALIAFILFAFVVGLVLGQISFARVQVGGSLYEGIRLKRDMTSALAAMKADLAILRGNLYSATLTADDAAAGRAARLISTIQSDLNRVRELQQLSHGGSIVTCGSCHAAEELAILFAPVENAAGQWRDLHERLQTILFPALRERDTDRAVQLFEGEFSSLFIKMIDEVGLAGVLLDSAFPPQVAHIMSETDKTRKGFITGGLVMTILFLVIAISLLQHTTRQNSQENEKLLAAANDLQKVSEEQSLKIDFIASATAEISKAIEEVAHNTGEALEASRDAMEIATYGKQTSGYTIDSIKSGASMIRETSQIIESLDKRSREIASIVSTINTIAMQTNLLALNAAVEAARAGEQGKGFSVVAGEVQNLAKRTKQATAEIEGMIQFVLAETARSSEAITKSKNEAEKSVKLIDAVSQSFDSIVTAAGTTSEMVGQIVEFANKQSKITEDISDSIRKIADIHQEAEAAASSLRGVSTY
jgi:hypothetical protein